MTQPTNTADTSNPIFPGCVFCEFRGVVGEGKYTPIVPCPECRPNPTDNPNNCQNCGGSGLVPCQVYRGQFATCQTCYGSGDSNNPETPELTNPDTDQPGDELTPDGLYNLSRGYRVRESRKTPTTTPDTFRVWYVGEAIEDQHYGWGIPVYSSPDESATREYVADLLTRKSRVMNGWVDTRSTPAVIQVPTLYTPGFYEFPSPVPAITAGMSPDDYNADIVLFCIDYPTNGGN